MAWNCEMLWHVFVYPCFLFSFAIHIYFSDHMQNYLVVCCFWPTFQVICDMKNNWHKTCFLMTLQVHAVSLSTICVAVLQWSVHSLSDFGFSVFQWHGIAHDSLVREGVIPAQQVQTMKYLCVFYPIYMVLRASRSNHYTLYIYIHNCYIIVIGTPQIRFDMSFLYSKPPR